MISRVTQPLHGISLRHGIHRTMHVGTWFGTTVCITGITLGRGGTGTVTYLPVPPPFLHHYDIGMNEIYVNGLEQDSCKETD